ncbi:hypothetical protein D9M69_439720 [compost metagenome]
MFERQQRLNCHFPLDHPCGHPEAVAEEFAAKRARHRALCLVDHQQPETARQLIAGVFDKFAHTAENVGQALRDDKTELCQESADLVGLGGSCTDEALAHPMQRQHGLLLDVLKRHEAHVGARDRFADRLGIGRVVLVGLDVGLDELWRHQLDGVTKCLQLARPVVGSAASFCSQGLLR